MAHYKYSDQLLADLEPPHTLEELQDAVYNPRPGTDVHHINEKKSAADDGFLPDQIEAPDNLVRISRIKHREITTWYQTPNGDYDWLSPREYLRGRSWEERRKVGLEALVLFKALKQ